MDTIFALSSGRPPAGIAVMRVSGPDAGPALERLVGTLPLPRRARYAPLHDGQGVLLDQAMVLWLPGPGTATGEDIAELHLHGGRAVIAAVESALGQMEGLRLRSAEAGEFTRRAFVNGRMDLAEAEGLAELLSAETELQRRLALEQLGGGLSRQVEQWRGEILRLAAMVEAELDFGDEDDVAASGGADGDFSGALGQEIGALADDMRGWLDRPRIERLEEGLRVVIAGPPNAGKSTLFNALVESEAAITSPHAGTTRDVIERSIAMGGVPVTLIDTAGLRDADVADDVEAIGIERAAAQIERADLILWLGPEGEGPEAAWEIAARADEDSGAKGKTAARHSVSALRGDGMGALRDDIIDYAKSALPGPGEGALNRRQAELVGQAEAALRDAELADPLLLAENLRAGRAAFDRLTGRATTEDMLDHLFGRFCIGK